MTLTDGIMLAHLFMTLFLAYKVGRLKGDIEVLYEGLAMAMEQLDMVPHNNQN